MGKRLVRKEFEQAPVKLNYSTKLKGDLLKWIVLHLSSRYKKILAQRLDKLWFHPQDFKDAVAYCCGLILTPQKPTLKLLAASTGTKAVGLSEFLRADILGWPTETLFDSVIETLPYGGELLLDVVVVPKENTSQMEAEWVYSACNKRTLLGQAYAVLTWTKENLTQVVGFRKIDDNHFQDSLDMIEHVLSFGLSVSGIRADGAYFKSGFRKCLKKLCMALISKPRRDSKWYLGPTEIQLKHWAAELPVESFHYYATEKVYARSFVMTRYDSPPCRIVVIRPKRSCDTDKILFRVSTDVNMTTREIIAGYRRRWRIEVLFRDCSQNLGLKCHQAFSQTSQRHVAMVFWVYNFLAQIKADSGKTMGRLVREFQKGSNLIRTSLSDLS